jgi:uncharacterized membrane protein
MNWSSCSNGGVATISCIPLLITNIIYWALLLTGTVTVIIIILAGIRLVLAQGDAKQLDQGRRTIGFAILGLIIIFLSFSIVNIIGSITGVACIDASKPLTLQSCN